MTWLRTWWQWSNRGWQQRAIGFGAPLIGLLIAIGAASGSDDPAETQAPVVVVAATSTPRATAVPPTSVPEPTTTPVVVPTQPASSTGPLSASGGGPIPTAVLPPNIIVNTPTPVGAAPAVPQGTILAGGAAQAQPTVPRPSLPPNITVSTPTSTPFPSTAVLPPTLQVTSPVARNATASATAYTQAGASCSIVYRVPQSGNVSSAQGLEAKTANGGGLATWSWTIGPGTSTGTGSVSVTCAGQTATVDIVVT